LVADDSPTHQRKANGILTGEGLDVITVSNGVAAIKKLPSIKPVVVLADVSMPGKDGYEVCEFVKNSPELHNVPVLLIVSDMEPYDEARAARVGADGKVKKPFGDDLVAVVNRSIAQYEASLPRIVTPVQAPPPPPEPFPAPLEEEEAPAAEEEKMDFAGLSEGVAFAAPSLEESPTLAPEAEAPAVPEFQESTTEPVVAEEGMAAEPPSYFEETAAEPVLIEETTPLESPEEEEPEAARTMIFRAPVEIAEPILADELEVPMPVAEAAPQTPEAEAEVAPAAATTLDSFSLTEATAGHVRFAGPEMEVAPTFAPPAEEPAAPPAEAPEPVLEAPAPPEEAPAPIEAAAPPPVAPRIPDAETIYAIVHKVVVKMSPPALPSTVIESIARKVADEVTAELNSESPGIE
jgi:CheY-like chemotaxis protein